MSMTLACPSCAQQFVLPDSAAGTICHCPGCGMQLQVPAVAPSPPSFPATPSAESSIAGASKPCPSCGRSIPWTALKCRHCGAQCAGQPPERFAHSPGPGHPQPFADQPKSHLVFAIVVTLLCCMPTGVVAIVYASRVDSLVAAGDLPAARQASRSAERWCAASVAVGLIFAVLQVALVVGGFRFH